MKALLIMFCLSGLLAHGTARAQMFAGFAELCGVPVVVMPTPQNAVAARDQFGRPVIYVDPAVMGNWTTSRKFALAHECGHHMLGHSLPMGMWFRNMTYWATRAQELEADCWAAAALARAVDLDDLRRTIAQFASMGAASQGAYPTGNERANAAANCAGFQLQSSGGGSPSSRRGRWQYEYSRVDSNTWRKSMVFSSEESCQRSQARRNRSDDFVALDCEEVEE